MNKAPRTSSPTPKTTPKAPKTFEASLPEAGLLLPLLDQAARLTIRLAGAIDAPALRFSERQRLARTLGRLQVALTSLSR